MTHCEGPKVVNRFLDQLKPRKVIFSCVLAWIERVMEPFAVPDVSAYESNISDLHRSLFQRTRALRQPRPKRHAERSGSGRLSIRGHSQ